MMKFAVVCALLGAALAVPTSKLSKMEAAPGMSAAFEMWKQTHGKTYASEAEHNMRLETFVANAILVEKHNSEGHSYTLGLNQFADMTTEEFTALQTLWPSTLGTENSTAPQRHQVSGRVNPASVDWRTKGAVNPIKNQGQCGSCWAFSTVDSYEGQVALKTGKLTSFSEQDLVDCVTGQSIPGTRGTCCSGCNGGLMDYGFAYMIAKQAGKDDTEASYPYKAADGTCGFVARDATGAAVTSYTDVKAGDESALKDAVANIGPISIAVDATNGWQLYKSGVFNPILGCGTKLNHGVGIVGYGTDAGKDYWIIRNSWGETWGESGYMRLIMGKNECGVANSAVYPVL
eukprot:c4586_g1_i1.p1 GENE.c4586_g1_i1~~c4586_g1_i1.p1  ORF type:complete len:359 (+),score=83.79 c4586_g1_i1:42-1079(+)